jgi:5-methylcytosine-specific restriction endonuclease McrA
MFDRNKYIKEWRLAHPGYDAAIIKRYKEKNPNHYKEYDRKNWIKNKDKLQEKNRLHQKNNPEMWATYARNRHAKKKLAGGKHSHKEIINLGNKQNWKCIYCLVNIKEKYHADHKIPVALNGNNYITNIQLLCPSCNSKKGKKDPIDFANEIGLLL